MQVKLLDLIAKRIFDNLLADEFVRSAVSETNFHYAQLLPNCCVPKESIQSNNKAELSLLNFNDSLCRFHLIKNKL